MPVTNCIKDTCSNFSLSILAMEDEIFITCDLHSNETVTLGKHVAKYQHAKMDGQISQKN